MVRRWLLKFRAVNDCTGPRPKRQGVYLTHITIPCCCNPAALSMTSACPQSHILPRPTAEWLLWLDLDAIPINPRIPLTTYTHAYPDASVILARPAGDSMINFGVILLRADDWALTFLQTVLHLTESRCDVFPFEQGAAWSLAVRLMEAATNATAAMSEGRPYAPPPAGTLLGGYVCPTRENPQKKGFMAVPQQLLEQPQRLVVLGGDSVHGPLLQTLRGCAGPRVKRSKRPTAQGNQAQQHEAAQLARSKQQPQPAVVDCYWAPGMQQHIVHFAPAACPAEHVINASYAALNQLGPSSPYYPIIVTGASETKQHGHILQRALLNSVWSTNPQQKVIVYDLGLAPASARNVAAHPAVLQLRRFRFERYPPHFDISIDSGRFERGAWAWKPAIIAEVLEQYSAVLWMDAGDALLPTTSLPRVFSKIHADGIVSPASRGDIKRYTYPDTIRPIRAIRTFQAW